MFEAGNMEFSLRFGAEEKLLLLLLVAELFPSLSALSFPLLFSFFFSRLMSRLCYSDSVCFHPADLSVISS